MEKKKNEPVHDKTYNMTCATSEDSDQAVHQHSLQAIQRGMKKNSCHTG